MIIYEKIISQIKLLIISWSDERSPVRGLEPETPPPLERSFTTLPQPLPQDQFIMLIDNNDYRMFRPVAIMIVEKAKINASGASWKYLGNDQCGLRSEIISCQQQPKEKSSVVDPTAFE